MIVQGRDHSGDLHLSAEVLVVGSGSGGAVVAKELSEAGWDVLILEEGPYVPLERYRKLRPTEALATLGREAGTTAAIPLGDTPAIGIMAGRAVGGSSLLTGGICFRLPDRVIHTWNRELGMKDYTQEALEAAYTSVEQELSVSETPARLQGPSSELMARGLAKKGISLKPLRRNIVNCESLSRCTFTCSAGAKRSVDVTFLKKAQERGTRIYSDCRVDRLVTRGGKVTGVVGRVLNGPDATPLGRLHVTATKVILAAGSIHTPQILQRSGVGRRSRQVGKNLTVHPCFRVLAFFDEVVATRRGAMQTTYIDHFEHEGLTLVEAVPPFNVVAGSTPGSGPDYFARMARVDHLAMYGGMIHDEGRGRIWPSPIREPLITYRMTPLDKDRMIRGIKILAESFFEAGAKEILLPVFGSEAARSVADLDKLHNRIPGRMFECVAFHPLGTARMGVDPSWAVVSPDGESFDLEGLYVADGSLFPTPIGVNSQLPIMTVATRIAWKLREQKRA